MTNIHTPEGFKVSFLSNLSGGSSSAAYPKFNFPDFLPEPTDVIIPVGEFGYLYYYRQPAANCYTSLYNMDDKLQVFVQNYEAYGRNIADAYVSNIYKDCAKNGIIFMDKKMTFLDNITIITALTRNGRALQTAIDNLTKLTEELSKEYQTITVAQAVTDIQTHAAYTVNQLRLANPTITPEEQQEVYKSTEEMSYQDFPFFYDPAFATKILLKYQYPKTVDGKYFLGGQKLTEFINQIFIPVLLEENPTLQTVMVNKPYTRKDFFGNNSGSAVTSKKNFTENIKTLVETANKYLGAYYFDPIERSKSQPLQEQPLYNVSPALNKKYVLPKGIDTTTTLQRLMNGISKEAEEARNYITFGFGGSTFLRGGKAAEYNNATLYKNFYKNIKLALKSHNKDLSNASDNKITSVINSIERYENYLKNIFNSLEVILRENNYEADTINDWEAYKKLIDKKNKVSKSLNRSYIKMGDVANVLAKVVGIISP